MIDIDSPPSGHGSARRRAALLMVVVAAVLVGAMCVARWSLHDTTPDLTEDALDTAEARWKSDGPASYDMEVTLGGARAGLVHVEVRNGQVTSIKRDGKTPPERTWHVWSVPGQFDTLYRELELAADPVGEIDASNETRWLLRAEFDRQFGYPKRYRRMVIGTGPDISWEVSRFDVVE